MAANYDNSIFYMSGLVEDPTAEDMKKAGMPTASMRTFDTGATRNTDDDKLDFEGFLSPLALQAFAEYMHKHRIQADGAMRASDNWQKGMPIESYMKSMWRHFFAVWSGYRSGEQSTEDLAALMFNVQGMLHEVVKNEQR